MPTRLSYRRFVVAMLAALVVTALPAVAAAQATRGTILGTITDQTGATMPGVTVIATETRTNISHEAVTNETGNFTLPNIPDGVYNIKAELQGFKTVVREGIRLAVNTSIRVDLALSVGELAETVTVSGETPLLQTDRTDTGRVLESIQVASMPLSFNRNFQGMMATVPGASRPYRPHSEFFNSQDSLSTEVNGQSRMANNVLIEGLDNNQRTGLLTLLIPPAEAIDTVSVTTSNYDAEFGRAAGAVTSVTLKSGTNSLRGSAFWFGNTDATNSLPASTYFSATRTKAPTKYNQFGFTLGGPIKKNRLFFFGDFQRTQDRLGTSYLFVVPTQAFRNGDFSAAPTKVYDPATGDATGNNRVQFANNQIPANRISPIALNLLKNLPLPNRDVALGVGNYQVDSYRDKNTNSFDAKVSYAINSGNQISGRFSYQKPTITQLPPTGYGDWGGPLGGGFMATGTNMTYSTAANWTHTFSNTFLMEVRGGTNYYHNEALTTANGKNLADQVGITGVNLDDWSSGPTTITINNGFSNPMLGYVNSLPWDRWERTWEFATVLTKVRNNHTIKFGANYRRNSDKLLQTQDNQGPRGGFTFSGAQTGSTADTGANSGIANSFASFLLDLPSGMARDLKVLEDVGTKHWALYSFVQDKWQVSSRMTVDLGLRFEYYDPLIGLAGKGSLSNYDPATNSLLVSGFGNIANDFGVKKDFNNWSPRLGTTFRLDEKTVIRGGFGASTTPFPDNRYAFNYPVKQNNSYQAPNSYSKTPYNMGTGFPAPTYLTIPDSGIVDANLVLASSLFYVPNDLQQGTLYSWNVAFQRELWWGLTGEAAYVGNMSNDVLNRFPANAGMVLGAGNAGRPLYAKYGKTSGVENLAWKGKTRYNGLQMKLDRRFRNGWLVTNSYTYAKAQDYANDNGGPSTPIDPERSWGLGNFDRRHVYVGSFVWSLPWYKDRDAGALHWILGNWQVSGILTLQSGQPLDITMSNASLNTPDNTQRPNSSGTPEVLGAYGPGKLYFDTSVFSAPAANTFGTRTRNMGDVRGPGFTNLDFSVVKQFGFGGSRSGEFRVDIWNLPNTVHMSNPNTTFATSTFGQVTSAYNERQMRFSFRFIF